MLRCFVSVMVAVLSAPCGQALLADEKSDQRLELMAQRAKQTSVSIHTSREDARVGELIPQPLFRYDDQPRDILDASYWGWQLEGRPIAFQKIEYYERPNLARPWFYCFASLSPEIVEAKWESGGHWRATEAGIELARLPDGPPPANGEARLRLQMKKVARRFLVESTDEIAKTKQKLRLLSRPLHYYGGSDSDIVAGAVFGFAYGTNPDALLLVELHRNKDPAGWHYAWVQMTTAKLTAKLDQKLVWEAAYRVPAASRPSIFGNWLFFYESVGHQIQPE